MQQANEKSVYSIENDVAAVGRIDVVSSILQMVCKLTGMRFAAVARVTSDRWVACAVNDGIEFGLGVGGELPVESTICHEIEQCHQAVVIDHVDEHPEFRNHPTPKRYGFQSYISIPIIRSNGEFFGTLCALDPLPAKLEGGKALATFEAFAGLIALQLETEDQLQQSQARLMEEQRTAELREQFIAVIGHDLRNPLFASIGNAELLLRMDLPEKALRYVRNVHSSGTRMAGLLDNLLDFARGRLGGGFALKLEHAVDLDALLRRVVAELQTVHPERRVEVDLGPARPVWCDPARIAQIFSNLLANALTHGAKDYPVRVCARSQEDAFTLMVTNQGEPIPTHLLDKLFLPFSRLSAAHKVEGLGLGLYIAHELARAHGGAIGVESTAEGTTFTLKIPGCAPVGAEPQSVSSSS